MLKVVLVYSEAELMAKFPPLQQGEKTVIVRTTGTSLIHHVRHQLSPLDSSIHRAMVPWQLSLIIVTFPYIPNKY